MPHRPSPARRFGPALHRQRRARPTTIQIRVYLNADPTALRNGHQSGAPLMLAYTYRIRTDTDDALA
ncbi:hypothetical protein [Nocardia shimofusensis]|uniref:hypothetical protein n=1 Tax=Nocardia shimofusensis TaxID=228596 RepID=UPI00082B0C22|nr:hypothetical protein [Nocardia shimofusensis]